jgi:hypothetical protein
MIPSPLSPPAMKTLAFALLASLALASPARAADEQSCDAAAFEVASRFVGFPDFSADNDARVASAACKASPDQPDMLLAAFAFGRQPAGKPMPDDDAKEVAVLLIDRAHGRVIASHRQLVEEDAATRFDRGSLSLDTARYLLAPHVRAFGMRFKSAGSTPSCADNGFGQLLTLFVPDADTLRPVLQLNMATERALAGCIGHGGPDSVVESADLTLTLAPTRSQGYADLVVHARIDTWIFDETRKAPKPRTETRTLRYDGQGYAVRQDDAWWLTDFGF